MSEKQKTLPELNITETEIIDTTKYVGVITTIEKIEIDTGKHGEFLKITTKNLDENSETEITAKNVYGLKIKDGVVSISDKSKLYEFMQSKKVNDYRELIGKEVKILSKSREGQDFLYFV